MLDNLSTRDIAVIFSNCIKSPISDRYSQTPDKVVENERLLNSRNLEKDTEYC